MNISLVGPIFLLMFCSIKAYEGYDYTYYHNIEDNVDDKVLDKVVPVFSIAFFASLINGLFSSFQTQTVSPISLTTEMTMNQSTTIMTTTTAPMTTTTVIPQSTLLMCANDALDNVNDIIKMSEKEPKKRKWRQRFESCQDLNKEISTLLGIQIQSQEFCTKANHIKKIKVQENCQGNDLDDLKNNSNLLENLIAEKLAYKWKSQKVTVNVTKDTEDFVCNIMFDMSVSTNLEYKDFAEDCQEVNENTTLLNKIGQYSQYNFSVTAENGVDFDCEFGTAFLDSNNSLSTVLLEDSIKCNANPSSCMTIGGNVPYSNCTFPFIYKGRQFQACTDVNHPGSDKSQLYCATEVDAENVAVPGKWGYCSSACGYCGGTLVGENSTRQSSSECGYHCLFNPKKIMSGSKGYYYGLRLRRPISSLFEIDNPTNYIGSLYGQHLFYTGNQNMMIECPETNFFDPEFNAYSKLILTCGPRRYRFTVYDLGGKLVATNVRNDRFGCAFKKSIPGFLSTCSTCSSGTCTLGKQICTNFDEIEKLANKHFCDGCNNDHNANLQYSYDRNAYCRRKPCAIAPTNHIFNIPLDHTQFVPMAGNNGLYYWNVQVHTWKCYNIGSDPRLAWPDNPHCLYIGLCIPSFFRLNGHFEYNLFEANLRNVCV